jgi:guanyl-specific ribonuclease Sa
LIALVVFGWVFKDLAGGTSPALPSSSSSASVRPSAGSAAGTSIPGTDSGLKVQALSSLPAQAAETWKLIEKNGPFPYPRNDGVAFQNREKRLPAQSAEYYREYTVPTPGSQDRGARRLVTGSKQEVFYTGDHYETFVVVDVRK